MRKLLATAVLAAISFNANAFPVEWTLNNFVFEDGGIATGGFTYDADSNELSNFSIVTSGGSLPGNTYDTYYASFGNHYGGTGIHASVLTGQPWIQIELTELLTNAGGIISFDAITGEFGSDGEDSYDRIFVSGTVSAVPIPAAAYLFGSGLSLLGWFRRKKA